MVAFFRKRMNLDDVAANLIGFAFDQNDVKLSMNEMPFPLKVNKEDVFYEMMFLRAFAVDIAIYIALDGRENEIKLLSDKYRDLIIEMMLYSTIKTGHDSIKTLETRHNYYVSAVADFISAGKIPGNIDTIANRIGELFAEMCDSTHSIEVCNFGSNIFKSVIGGVMVFLKSIKIKV